MLPGITGLAGFVQTATSSELLLDSITSAFLRAYSTRKLSNSYTGSALRVRRSSDNAEQDIGFVGEDLDSASLLSFVGSGDGFVTVNYDQSGNGQNATQTTTSRQHQIVSSGTMETFGGKPSIKSALGKYANFPQVTNMRSVSAVINYNAFIANNVLVGSNGSFNMHGSASGRGWLDAGAASTAIVNGSWRLNGSSISSTADTKVLNTDYYVNAVATSASIIVDTYAEDRNFNRNPSGQYPELLISSEDITADIPTIEANQAAYWGI